MSNEEHKWAEEHLAAEPVGGLTDEEQKRLERHVAECDECREELEELRSFDSSMEVLFEPVRAAAGMEDRVIHALRAVPEKRPVPLVAKISLGIAAFFLLGMVGFLFQQVRDGKLDLHPWWTWGSQPEKGPALARSREAVCVDTSDPAKKVKEMREVTFEAKRRLVSAEEMAQEFARRDSSVRAIGTDLEGAAFAGNANFKVTNSGRSTWSDGSEVLAQKAFIRTKPVGTPVFLRDAKEADHNECADEEEFQKAKGDSLDFVADKPFKGQGVYDAIGVSAGAGGEYGGRKKEEKSSYYSYTNNAPVADGKSTVHFRPGSELEHEKEKNESVAVSEKPAYGGEYGGGRESRRPPAVEIKAPQEGSDEEKRFSQAYGRKIIRSGQMEFEVESFDSSLVQITKIAGEEGGFIATINSDKLPNGKVRGTIIVRVPPERLDTLILKLRALGELKSQRLGSQDVTKHYTDLESRLRAARAMEERLIEIIKKGKGEIKDLLQAEKELGEWRTKIEEFEGEIRYYNNLISLATLSVTLYEKEIRTAFGVTETEKIQMGIEVQDVDKAYQDALKAISAVKGRITKSELKRYDADQFSALIHFEVKRDEAGPVRDRLKQLGNVTRMDIDRIQKTEGGSSALPEVRVTHKDTQFVVSIYNLTAVAPRDTVHINLACVDAEAAYKAILERVEKAGGRIVSSNLNRQKGDKTSGAIQFEIKEAEAGAVELDVRAQGEIMRFQIVENRDRDNSTKSKRGFQCQIFALGMVAPRETRNLHLAAPDVTASYNALLEAIRKADGRVLSADLDESNRENVTAELDFEFRREHEDEIKAALAAAGAVYSRTSNRAQNVENVVDSKVLLKLKLINLSSIPPRETQTLAVEVSDVDRALGSVEAGSTEAGGRTIDKHLSRQRTGQVIARIVIDVPLKESAAVAEKIKDLGTVRAVEASKNPRVPDGNLARAQMHVTLSNSALIIPNDAGVWSQIRSGLSTSVQAFLFCLNLVIIGVLFVLPWALILWVVWRVIRRHRAKAAAAGGQ